MIQNYTDYCRELLAAGFSVASGGNDEGVFGLLKYSWISEPSDSLVRWHTGDPEISVDEGVDAITSQVYRLNPAADAKKIKKFIYG